MPSQAQRKRAEARENRRGGEAEESAQDNGASTDDQPLDAVKQAAKVAAASVAAGAVAAAVRALADRQHSDDGESTADREEPQEQEPLAEAEPEESPQSEVEVEQEPEAVQEPAEREQPEPQRREPAETSVRHEPVQGASAEEAGEVVDAAKRQLELLVGRSPETVSSLERTDDGWLATVEVVEVSRVPESTDVLASYEIDLDDDRNLRRYARVRRYHRSQADREGGS